MASRRKPRRSARAKPAAKGKGKGKSPSPSRFADAKVYDPSTARRVPPKPEPTPTDVAMRLEGLESRSECGCRGLWRVQGDALWWKPEQLCAVHAHNKWTAAIQLPPPEYRQHASEEIRRAIQAAGWGPSLWPLPCKLCGAEAHDKHGALCVFWDVNTRTPF